MIDEEFRPSHLQDWAVLVMLARDAWVETSKRSPTLARLEAERWSLIHYPLFHRLAFFAAKQSDVVSSSLALKCLLADNGWWLWSPDTESETIRLLVALSPKLKPNEMNILCQCICDGAPKEIFGSDTDSQDLQEGNDYKIWLRLAQMKEAGAILSPASLVKLQTLTQEYPMWNIADEHLIIEDNDAEWESISPPQPLPAKMDEWLNEHPKSDSQIHDPWKSWCKLDYENTSQSLIKLAKQGVWFPGRWRQAIGEWTGPSGEVSLQAWKDTGELLLNAPVEVVREASRNMGTWLEDIARNSSAQDDFYVPFIKRILDAYGAGDNPPAKEYPDRIPTFLGGKGSEKRGPVSDAINHPVGYAVQALLQYWHKHKAPDNSAIEASFRKIFSDLCDTGISIFRHGRVILASQAALFFHADPEWADQFLIPLFDWNHSSGEAQIIWRGYLWMLQRTPEFMQAIKKPFLETAKHYGNLGDDGERYAALLTYVALEECGGIDKGSVFSGEELAGATNALPEGGLASAARTLASAIKNAGNNRETYWKKHIVAYMENIWPQSKNSKSKEVAKSLATLCIAAKERFPQALELLKHWFLGVDEYGYLMEDLLEDGLINRFPKEALEFLDLITPDNADLPQYVVTDCLNAIKEKSPKLVHDSRFHRLQTITTYS